MKKLIIFVFILFSCKGEDHKIVALDLQQHYTEMHGNDGSQHIPPPPPRGAPFYTDNNFIIDNEGNFYHYRLNVPFSGCGTSLPDTKDFRPEFIGLLPDSLHYVRKDNFEDYFVKNVKADHKKGQFIVASADDTFHSKQLSRIMDKAETDKMNHWIYIIRKMTQEENEVLKHKKSGASYSPSKIKWDTTKTKFWPKNLAVIR